MSKVRPKGRVETIDEFLARGGKITKIAEAAREKTPEVVRKTAVGPATFLTLEEADLFHGEVRKGSKPKKSKPTAKIDINALPPALRAKFIAKLKEQADGEEAYQEELSGIGIGLKED